MHYRIKKCLHKHIYMHYRIKMGIEKRIKKSIKKCQQICIKKCITHNGSFLPPRPPYLHVMTCPKVVFLKMTNAFFFSKLAKLDIKKKELIYMSSIQ